MAVSWGAVSGHLAVGIDIRHGAVGPSTTAITVYVDYWVHVSNFRYDDNQRLTFTGSLTGVHDFHNYQSPAGGGSQNVQFPVLTLSFVAPVVYGGGTTYTFGVSLSGAFDGSAPSHVRTWTAPARPASAPGQVAKPTVNSITSSSAKLGWTAPASNGSAIIDYQVQIDDNEDFSSPAVNLTGVTSSNTVFAGLTRATTYRARIRARNAVGYGAWSPPSDAFTTASSVPDKITTFAAVADGPESVRGAWAAPDDGGSAITGYDLQAYSATLTRTSSLPVVLSGRVTGLAPSTAYAVRVRAKNANGDGPWSDPISVTTLPGARIGQGGAFRDVRWSIGDPATGTLRPVRPHIGTEGSFT